MQLAYRLDDRLFPAAMLQPSPAHHGKMKMAKKQQMKTKTKLNMQMKMRMKRNTQTKMQMGNADKYIDDDGDDK